MGSCTIQSTNLVGAVFLRELWEGMKKILKHGSKRLKKRKRFSQFAGTIKLRRIFSARIKVDRHPPVLIRCARALRIQRLRLLN